MKKLIALALTALMLLQLFAACGSVPSAPDTTGAPVPENTADTKDQAQAAGNAALVLQETLGLTEADTENLTLLSVQTYEDENVVRYAQHWQGVEIYGSSLVAVSGEEDFCMGTYYDLSEAFGEDFQDLVTQASTLPAWLEVSTEDFTVLTDTLRPVIFITEEDTACVARCFQAEAVVEGIPGVYEVVTDIDGTICYTYHTDSNGYTTAEVTNGTDSLTLIEEKSTYYAYNEEHNVYVYHTSDADDALTHLGGGGAAFDLDLMYSSGNDTWNSGKAKSVFRELQEYLKVAAWYRDTFGYEGIDGNGGRAILVTGVSGIGSVAMNTHRYGYVTVTSTLSGGVSVADAPEILAHEYCHAVMKNICGTASINQTGALNEAVSDVFGAMYLGNGNWHLAQAMASSGNDKDIPGTSMTMDDYIYDSVYDNASLSGASFSDRLKSALGIIDFQLSTSNGSFHENAFILSHTLYRIWDQVFNRNYRVFGNVMFRSLRYLPSDADFTDFRQAFLYACGKVYNRDTVAYASSFFDVAGIQAGKTAQLKNINKPEVNRSYAFIDLAYMSYGEISRLDWDEFYFFDSFDNPGSWFVQASAGNAGVSLNFSGETEDPDAYPWMLRIYDYTGGAAALPITDGVYTGTIYAFAKNDIPGLSELEIAPIGGAGIVSMATYYPQQGCQVTLYFSGSGDTAVLTDAEITFFE